MRLKLKRESAGFYCIECHDKIIHIWRISRDLWGYCYDKGMTRGTGKTLKEIKSKFID